MSCRRICFEKPTVGAPCLAVKNQYSVSGMQLRTMRRRLLITVYCLLLTAHGSPVKAQFLDPQSGVIISVLREISLKNQLGLEEQRLQTAKMVQQLKQFYDTYTLLRQDAEFTQGLYRDFKAIDNMRLNNTFAVSNFIMNADRLNYWLPGATQDINRSVMDTQSLLGNADELRRTYESFALSAQDAAAPQDAETRRTNAIMGQEAFSRALFEQSLRDQQMAKTYDSMAVELYRQVKDGRNKFTEAERTQFLIESVKLRELSNSYYEKYLKQAQEAHNTELTMFDQKMDLLRSKTNWKAMKSQVNRTSKIRYGFFDITPAAIE